ncbi:DUF4224 domain-containing protein [Rugamonas sp. FT82W]|uniref:DUF4224 domain-containing protein n=1 Tax=Duganella vulcania TaxID=2692166 RepID=A0A845G867_9BURK|nr:DUF4224 domain-containing protein [Duganella vulcania]
MIHSICQWLRCQSYRFRSNAGGRPWSGWL